jgi:hypothetical protein
MSVFQSLRAWSNPGWPSTPTYGALARFAVRRGGLVAALAVAGQFAVLLPGGHYTSLALVVGALVASGFGFLAGAAIAFDDHAYAALAAAATVGVLAATWAAMRAFALDQGLVVALLAFAAFAPVALGTLGYTAGERATWRAAD